MKRFSSRVASALLIGLAALAAWGGSGSSRTASQSATPATNPAQPSTTQSSAPTTATAAAVAAIVSTSGAADGAAAPMSPALSVATPSSQPDGVSPTPVPGIVEVRRGADIVYMSRDGKYVFTGDLYQVAGRNDLTEARRRELRRTLINAVPESQMLVFSPARPLYTVTVFTDVDCVYCRALQRQIADYNRLGIKVRYVFFPRTGPNTESWYKAEQVWCSSDRRAALTRAKLGEPLQAKVCANTPVAREYALGQAIGLDGTPGIVAANGALVGGYLPPDALLDALKTAASNASN